MGIKALSNPVLYNLYTLKLVVFKYIYAKVNTLFGYQQVNLKVCVHRKCTNFNKKRLRKYCIQCTAHRVQFVC